MTNPSHANERDQDAALAVLEKDVRSGRAKRVDTHISIVFLEPAGAAIADAIGGKSGTGKSLLARDVAPLPKPLPGAVILRSDVIRNDLYRVDPLVALPEGACAAEVTARVYRTLNERARAPIAQGPSAIIDAAFLREAERDALAAETRTMAADFRPIFLDADLSGASAASYRAGATLRTEVASLQEMRHRPPRLAGRRCSWLTGTDAQESLTLLG